MEQLNTNNVKAAFTCIVADDSEFARKNIAKVVATIGGTVLGEAKNGVEAIDLYFKLNPDILLLDITMPQLDGIAALTRIIEKDKNARIIIVSSTGHKEMVWKAICTGAKHFITKPYRPDYASMIIMDVVEKKDGDSK